MCFEQTIEGGQGLIPDTLLKAAKAVAMGSEIDQIAVWEECPLTDDSLLRLPRSAEGVCASVVKDDKGERILKPFLWREDLADNEIALAEALFKIGLERDSLDAAAALIGEN